MAPKPCSTSWRRSSARWHGIWKRCSTPGSRRCKELFDAYPLANDSMLSFGIPDLSGISLLNPHDRELLREQLRRAIEVHEPRLSRVRVNLDAPREMERHLRFRVDAVLKVHPHRPPVTFDATLQLSSNVYKVQG